MALLHQANRPAPMVLRINARKTSVAQYLDALRGAGLEGRAMAHPLAAQAVVLARPSAVQVLPGWDAGWVSVQDLHAQFAAGLLLGPGAGLPPLGAGARVLDACAAPGGKTAHLLEQADLDLLALDSDPGRLVRLTDNLKRLGLACRTACADARAVDRWWDGRPFDAILLDAPCSASGVVRRHPDVRWLRRPDDVPVLARTQAELLDALWPLLAPGGRLLYATCSVFKAEGAEQIDAFLQRPMPRRPWLCPGSPGHLLGLPDNSAAVGDGPCRPGRLDPAGDGFYYAMLSTLPPD
jgi:16S rRNA (cytosine967-C5)-methyltransferase